MTDAPKCEKCGSEMVMCDLVPISAAPGPEEGTASMAYRYKTRCRLDPKDCRIKELERKLDEANEDVKRLRIIGDAAVELIQDCRKMIGVEVGENLSDSLRIILESFRTKHWRGYKAQITGLTSERDAALAQVGVLREALEELIEVADLRGDSDLPHPADDPKLWTARMIDAWDSGRDALSATSTAAEETMERIEREVLEKACASVMSLLDDSPANREFRSIISAAILGEKENN